MENIENFSKEEVAAHDAFIDYFQAQVHETLLNLVAANTPDAEQAKVSIQHIAFCLGNSCSALFHTLLKKDEQLENITEEQLKMMMMLFEQIIFGYTEKLNDIKEQNNLLNITSTNTIH